MEASNCTLPTHPRTGLMAVGIVAGRPVWPIKGGSGEGEGEGGGSGEGGGVATFTAPGSQAELDRIVQDRLSRLQKQYGMTPEEAKVAREKAEKHDALELELSSDKDKAVREAREQARTEALAEATPRVVRAEFKAAAKGVLTPEQVASLLEDLDLSKYVTDKGDADEDKIAKKITAFAPPKGNGGTQQHRPLGQGHQQQAAPNARDLGRAEAEKRFGKKQ